VSTAHHEPETSTTAMMAAPIPRSPPPNHGDVVFAFLSMRTNAVLQHILWSFPDVLPVIDVDERKVPQGALSF